MSVQETFKSTKTAYQTASLTAQRLQQKALGEPLTDDEETALAIAERRVEHLAPIMQRLEREAAFSQAQTDTAEVLAQWEGMVVRKRAAYQHFAEASTAMFRAFRAVRTVHAEQEALIRVLPRDTQEKISFPDGESAQRWMLSRLPDGQAWTNLLLAGSMPNHGQWHEALDADPGLKPLSQRALERYLRKE